MHYYLRSVGFPDDIDGVEKFIKQAVIKSIAKNGIDYDDKGECGLVKIPCGDGFGIFVKGRYTSEGKFLIEYHYPYMESDLCTACEELTIERHADKDSYAVICDEIKVGVSLIFYLQNILDYYHYMKERKSLTGRTVILSAFAREGSVLFPVQKTDSQIRKSRKEAVVRDRLINAARQGDEHAMESLTIEEMDTYSKITERVQREDIYSIVDTSFMPCGVECDQYAVIGTILDCKVVQNSHTGKELWRLELECNEFNFPVLIGKEDLLGEPQVGRRFKGRVWMCAKVNFE